MNKFYIILLVIISLCLAAGGCAANLEAASIRAPETANNEETAPSVQQVKTEDSKSVAKADAEAQNENTEQAADDAQVNNEGEKKRKATPSENGRLSVSGTSLVDESGNEIRLQGISTHGIAWFPEYINEECFNQIKEDFGANVIRLAMYTSESGGYNTDGDKGALKQLIKDGVNYANKADMYAIIDWHTLSDGDPNTYIDEAKVFFTEMSEEFADYDNVIYEICNEPNNGTTWKQIKEYAENIIPVIRENDPDAVILTGTPNWCQFIDEAAEDPLDFENVMYTVHYYAATHKEDLREKIREAHTAGLPIFISEYGICDASGNGAVDYEQARIWAELTDELNLSSVMWNLSNKDETSAMITAGCDKTSGFTEDDLSDAGLWIKAYLNGEYLSEKPENGNIQNESREKERRTAQSVPGEPGLLEIDVDIDNGWEENGKKITQYRLRIKNEGERTDGWRIMLEFDEDFAYKDGWNGNFTSSGNSLIIKNTDYNGVIENGETVADIGFIIAGEGKIVNAS